MRWDAGEDGEVWWNVVECGGKCNGIGGVVVYGVWWFMVCGEKGWNVAEFEKGG